MQRKIENLLDQYTNKCLEQNDLSEIIRKITNQYVEMGYITTRVELPEQDISGGVLRLNIIEGFIEDIDVESDHKLIPPFLPLKTGNILSLRDIEQTYDHFGRVSSNNVNILIKPGNEKGGSKILIKNKPTKKWKIKTGIDNSGSKHKGELLNFTNISVENFLGLNESYFINKKTSLGNMSKKYTTSNVISVSVPFGYNDVNYIYSHTKNKNSINGGHKIYSSKGNSTTYKITFNRLIHRNATSKTTLSFGAGRDIYSNFLDESKIEVSSYKLSKYDFGISCQKRLDSSVISIGAILTTGVNKSSLSNFSNLRVPNSKFTKFNFDTSWHKPLPIILFDRKIEFRSQLSTQHSNDMLVSSEKFSLGGLSSVRGFKEYRESADNAAQLRNELVLHLPNASSKVFEKFLGDFSIFTSFDIGHFYNYEEYGNRKGTMSGSAVGVRNSNGVFDIDLVVSRPIQSPIDYKHKNIIYFSLGLNV